MDIEGFRQSMRRRGKKPLVVDGLVLSIEQFNDFLGQKNSNLSQASIEDLDAFADMLNAQQKGLARKVIRGVFRVY